MPDPFLDRVVQYPKRFVVQADGADGTDVNALDGVKIALAVEPGVITIPGTSLNAEELNKRIVGDFEDKTFTELRTLLDTLNIDKDQNANMLVNKILMRTLYNIVDNPGGPFLTTADWTSSGGGLAISGNNILYTNITANNFPSVRPILNIEAGRTILVKLRVKVNVVGVDRNLVLREVSSPFTTLDVISNVVNGEWNEFAIVHTMVANLGFRIDIPVTTGDTIEVEYAVTVITNNTHLSGLSSSEAAGQIKEAWNGKAKTINPKLFTIGKNQSNQKEFLNVDWNNGDIKSISDQVIILKSNTEYTYSFKY